MSTIRFWLVCSVVVLAHGNAEEVALEGHRSVPGLVSSLHHYSASQLAKTERHVRGWTHINETLFARIQSDLEPWKDGISLDMVERTYCTDYISSFRMQIVNGEVYFVGEMEGFLEFHRMAKLFILDVAQKHKLPDVDIVMTTFGRLFLLFFLQKRKGNLAQAEHEIADDISAMGNFNWAVWQFSTVADKLFADNCPQATTPIFGDSTTRCSKSAPLFTFSRPKSGSEHCVLWPTFSFGPGGWPLARIPSWESYLTLINDSEHTLSPFASRYPALFFRGAPTGDRENFINQLAQANADSLAMDVRMTGWTGLTPVQEYVSLPAHCNYKYLLSLPGNGYASRLRYLMLCASVTLWQDNGIEEFWYHAMEDKIHLVKIESPVAETASKDIWHNLKILEMSPTHAEAIGQAGKEFVETILSVDNVERYFLELLNAYHQLQTFQPTVHKDAVPIRYSAMGPDAQNSIHTRNCSHCLLEVEAETHMNLTLGELSTENVA